MAVHHDRYASVAKKATNPGTQFGTEAVRWKFIKKCGMPDLIKITNTDLTINLIRVLF